MTKARYAGESTLVPLRRSRIVPTLSPSRSNGTHNIVQTSPRREAASRASNAFVRNKISRLSIVLEVLVRDTWLLEQNARRQVRRRQVRRNVQTMNVISVPRKRSRLHALMAIKVSRGSCRNSA